MVVVRGITVFKNNCAGSFWVATALQQREIGVLDTHMQPLRKSSGKHKHTNTLHILV